jgi:hypothetical protein
MNPSASSTAANPAPSANLNPAPDRGAVMDGAEILVACLERELTTNRS